MKKGSEHTPTEDSFIHIVIIENPFEAQIVQPVLEDEGIPHLVRSFHDTAYDGLYQAQRGWGEIMAPARFRDQIMEIITEARAQNETE